MLVLGIETSCDETAAAVVEDALAVRSSVVASQEELHREYGGVVPEIASRAHERAILPVVREAIARAGVSYADIDAVAVGHRPGLIGSLLVGVSAAKALAWSLGRPLIGVDHVHAHLHAAFLGATRDELDNAFPALGLVVSGGHTSMYRVESATRLTRLGATIDDAVGEAYDKVATILGLEYPGGPALDRLAQEEGADDRAHDFPVSRLGKDSLDFSFSGLKTAVLYAVRGVPGRDEPRDEDELPDQQRRDVAASFQRAASEAVRLKLGRALAHVPGCKGLIVGGGVSANSRLRAEADAFARKHGLTLCLPEMAYCIDNAAMIAGLGALTLEAGGPSGLDLSPGELLKHCSIRKGRTSGPGGQHRNKVETHVTITHEPTGLIGQAGERRSAEVNRKVAVRRLRLTLATEHREPVPIGEIRSDLWRSRVRGSRIACNPSHTDYPSMLAEAMDVLVDASCDVKRASVRLGCSASQLVKLIKEHPPALERVNALRAERGEHPLR
eukprot:g5945.t1